MKRYTQTKYLREFFPITKEDIDFFSDWLFVDIHQHYWAWVGYVNPEGKIIGVGTLEEIITNKI